MVDAVTGDNHSERLRFTKDEPGEAFAQGDPAKTHNLFTRLVVCEVEIQMVPHQRASLPMQDREPEVAGWPCIGRASGRADL